MFPERQPHPVSDLDTAIGNGRGICQPRGYCGPFINGPFYDAFPDPIWHGIGECVHCRNTIHKAREELKQRLAARGFRNIRSAVEPKPSPSVQPGLRAKITLYHGGPF